MAKTLSLSGIQTGQAIEAPHVSQSINAFTGAEAYDITVSGSLTVQGPIEGTAGTINNLTSSYAITASYALNAGSGGGGSIGTLQQVMESGSSTTLVITASAGISSSGAIISPSFTGSLSGSALESISASFAQTASYVLNAISASFAQTASYVLNAVSASLAQTASFIPDSAKFPFSGSAVITGSLVVSSSNQEQSLQLYGSGSTIFSIEGSRGTLFSIDDDESDGKLFSVNNVSGTPVLEVHEDNTVKLGKQNGFGIVISGSNPLPNDADAKILITGSIYHLGSNAYFNSPLTASSFKATPGVINQLTASYAISSSVEVTKEISSSHADRADTASYVETAQTASYVTLAQTASYVETAQTASYVETAQTASYVETAQTASYVATASYTPTFQQVTDQGATTTNDITIQGADRTDPYLTIRNSGSNVDTSAIQIQSQDPFASTPRPFEKAGEIRFTNPTDRTLEIIAPMTQSQLGETDIHAAKISLRPRWSMFGSYNESIVEIRSNSYPLLDVFNVRVSQSRFYKDVQVDEDLDVQRNITASGNISASGYISASEFVGLITTAQTASYVETAQTASYVTLAQTASFVTTAQTASYIENAQTASYVLNAISSSYALSASYAVSASHEIIKEVSSSYADTASYVETAQTASYVTLAQTASFVTTAQTASFVTLAQTASYVTTAQTASYVLNAISSSYALTASFAENVSTPTLQTVTNQGASTTVPITSSIISSSANIIAQSFTGSLLGTSTTASYVENAQTASFVTLAQTASFVTTAQTASYIENAQTASYVLNAVSSSYAVTASHALNTVNAKYLVYQTGSGTDSIKPVAGSNTASGPYASIGGGCSNILRNSGSFIGGGKSNEICIGGFNNNCGKYGTIGGGLSNTNNSYAGTIAGGNLNTVSNLYSTVGGGKSNSAAARGVVGGGSDNDVSGDSSGILGGRSNTADAPCSFIIGSSISSTVSNHTHVNNLTTEGNITGSNISASGNISASSFSAPPGVINQLTASYAISASVEVTKEISSSYADTASYVENAQTASYVTLAQTASYVTLAQTASYVTLAQTASYVTTAQTASYVLNAVSSSYALTASHALNSDPFPYTGSALITNALTLGTSLNTFDSALIVTGSTIVTGNISSSNFLFAKLQETDTSGLKVVVYNPTTGQFFRTGSYGGGEGFPFSGSAEITGSLLVSGSNVDFTDTTGVSGSFSGSFEGEGSGITGIISSSYALTSSYVENAQTASYVGTALNANDLVVQVKNTQTSTILKGQVLHSTGVTGEVIDVITASNDSAASMPGFAVANQNINSNASGQAIISGKIKNIDTSGLTAGSNVYVNLNGDYTGTKPTGSSLIQNIGVVGKVNATEGELIILGAGRSNDVPNISPGYIWIGNSDSVATPTATSSIQNVVSSSYASTASYVEIAQTASYVTLAQTASYVTTAQTASFVLNAVSSSYALSASYAISASVEIIKEVSSSYADTASYVETSQTASYVLTAQTASYVTLAQTASYVLTAQTASYVTLAQTASFVTTAQTASYVLASNIDQPFTDITASGNISASGYISASSFNAAPGTINELTASHAMNVQPENNFMPVTTHTTNFNSTSSYAGHYNIVGGDLSITVTTGSTPTDLTPGMEWNFFQTSSGNNFTFTVGTGVNLVSRNAHTKLAAIGSAGTLKYISDQTFHLIGDLTL